MSAFAESLLRWLADYYVLATALLAATFVCLVFVRQPARRLAVAWAATAGLVVLAVLTALPGWPRLPIAPPPVSEADSGDGAPAGLHTSVLAEQTLAQADMRVVGKGRAEEAAVFDISLTQEEMARLFKGFDPKAGPAGKMGPAREATLTRPLAELRAKEPPPAPGNGKPARAEDWSGLIVGGFLGGALLALAWMGLGAVQVRRLCRHSHPAPPELQALLARVVGTRKRLPRLLLSPRLGQPVALGVWRPAILLPAQATTGAAGSQLEAVMAHEWAHIRRGDLWLLALGRWLLPVLFAHPLFWWLRGRTREDQEALADASAAGAGGAIDYAATLLHWVRLGRKRRGAAAALALWGRPSELKRRITMLLNPTFDVETRCPGRWRLSAWTLTGAAALALSVVTLRPAPQAAAQEPQAKPAAQEKKEPPPARTAGPKQATQQPPARKPQTLPVKAEELLNLTGRVENQEQKPVAGAVVAVVGLHRNRVNGRSVSFALATGRLVESRPLRPAAEQPQVLGKAVTDAKGLYRLQIKKPLPTHELVALVRAKGYGLGWQFVEPQVDAAVPLQPEQVVRGRLIDLQGQPAAGVKVYVSRVGNRPGADTVYEYRLIGGLRDEVQLLVEDTVLRGTTKTGATKRPKRSPPPALRFVDPPAKLPFWPEAFTTDAKGRFTLRGVPRGQGVGLQVRDPRYALQSLSVRPQDKARPAEVTLVLEQARSLEGTVVDASTGKPIPHARLSIPAGGFETGSVAFVPDGAGDADWRGRRVRAELRGLAFALLRSDRDDLPGLDVRADKDGKYKIPLFLADSYSVRVSPPDGQPYLPMRRTVSWPKAAARQEVKMGLTRGVWVKGRVTVAPGGKPVADARIDFWAPGLKLPAGVRFPRPLTAGADGRFQVLLPPAKWYLLANSLAGVFGQEKVAAAELTGGSPVRIQGPGGGVDNPKGGGAKQFFYPDGWVALDLKPRADTQEVAFKFRRLVLRGKLVNPDGKPAEKAFLFYRHPTPVLRPVGLTFARRANLAVNGTLYRPLGTVPGHVEVRKGQFEVPVRDVEAEYQLLFLDAKNKLGALAQASGRETRKRPLTVQLAACGSAKARFVDAKGKPKGKYQPTAWLMLPGAPAATPNHGYVWADVNNDGKADLIVANYAGTLRLWDAVSGFPLYDYDRVLLGQADPLHYGKGFATDAKGKISFPVLIPGATYRIGQPTGTFKDFKVEAGKTLDLKTVTIQEPFPTLRNTRIEEMAIRKGPRDVKKKESESKKPKEPQKGKKPPK
jgi:protocatechuate 3,4-dioxygenase beta subunit